MPLTVRPLADLVARDIPMSALDWVLLTKDAVSVGDLVSAEAGGMPIYRVVAVADGLAWLQGDRRPALQIMPLDRFHWKAARLGDAAQPPLEFRSQRPQQNPGR